MGDLVQFRMRKLRHLPCKQCGVQDRYKCGLCRPCAIARSRASYQRKRISLSEYNKRPDVKSRVNARRRERYASSQERRKIVSIQNRTSKYKIDLVAELQRCGSCCEICGRGFVELGSQRQRGPRVELEVHVDHDHTHNVVRGLLCATCNLMLGYGKDSSNLLRAGAEYLDRANAKREAHHG